MTRAQFRFERALTLSASALALVAACGGPQNAGGAGATCFRDDDCEAGLICVAPLDSTARVCSNDPTPLVSNVQRPEPMETGGTGGVAGTAGMDAGGEPAETGGTAATAGGGATSGGGGSDAAGTGGSSGGTAGGGAGGTGGGAGGTGGTAGSGGGGTGGTTPEGGAPD